MISFSHLRHYCFLQHLNKRVHTVIHRGYAPSISPITIQSLPTETIYIIDGTALLYRSFYGMESKKRFAHIITGEQYGSTPCAAVVGFAMMIARLLRDIKPKYVAVAFDSGRTFRKDMYPAYKQQRTETPQTLQSQFALAPIVLDELGICTIAKPGYEADDIMASLGHWAQSRRLNVVHVAVDKDMLQLVAPSVYVMDPQTRTIVDSAAVEAKYGVPSEALCDLFALMGDSADNIPGVRGIGIKTAATLISSFGSLEALCDIIHSVRDEESLVQAFTDKLKKKGKGKSVKSLVSLLKDCNVEDVKLFKSLVTLRKDVDLVGSYKIASAFNSSEPHSSMELHHEEEDIPVDDLDTFGIESHRQSPSLSTPNCKELLSSSHFRYRGELPTADRFASTFTHCGAISGALDIIRGRNIR